MTRRVVTVTPDTPILMAAKLMLENHISGLPVVDASACVVGIISETDLLREDGKSADGSPWLQMVAGADGPTSDPAQLGARKVDEIMSRTPVTVAPNASMAQRLSHTDAAPHQAVAGDPGRQACRHYWPRRPGAGVRPVRRETRSRAGPRCQRRLTPGRARTTNLAQPCTGGSAVLTILFPFVSSARRSPHHQ